MRVSPIVAVAGTLALMSAPAGAARAPERTIRGHTVVSTHDPAVLIELPASATYVGADRWLLSKYADDIELHAFVDADPARQVRRLYWVRAAYSEDTVVTGFSADDLARGGRAHDQWSGIEAAVIARAQRSIKFR